MSWVSVSRVSVFQDGDVVLAGYFVDLFAHRPEVRHDHVFVGQVQFTETIPNDRAIGTPSDMIEGQSHEFLLGKRVNSRPLNRLRARPSPTLGSHAWRDCTGRHDCVDHAMNDLLIGRTECCQDSPVRPCRRQQNNRGQANPPGHRHHGVASFIPIGRFGTNGLMEFLKHVRRRGKD